eukprot:TRINITY_DN35932_c0_g1_i2.p1 TRINITY_DN35932_c0_g1~~TRINITY_DN35932_c0_g1_i2.p1  ORF type:complete len:381 (+),score=96.30 TRINITY_DN35932_c0_g1_i2:113-1255(+)
MSGGMGSVFKHVRNVPPEGSDDEDISDSCSSIPDLIDENDGTIIENYDEDEKSDEEDDDNAYEPHSSIDDEEEDEESEEAEESEADEPPPLIDDEDDEEEQDDDGDDDIYYRDDGEGYDGEQSDIEEGEDEQDEHNAPFTSKSEEAYMSNFAFRFGPRPVKKPNEENLRKIKKSDSIYESTDDSSMDEKEHYEKFDYQENQDSKGRPTFPKLRPGFLNRSAKPNTSYSGAGVGNKDYVRRPRKPVHAHTHDQESTTFKDEEDVYRKPAKAKVSRKKKQSKKVDTNDAPEVANIPKDFFEERRAYQEEQRRKMGLTEESQREEMLQVHDKKCQPVMCAMRSTCTTDSPQQQSKGGRIFLGQQWIQINCSEGCTVCYHYKKC